MNNTINKLKQIKQQKKRINQNLIDLPADADATRDQLEDTKNQLTISQKEAEILQLRDKEKKNKIKEEIREQFYFLTNRTYMTFRKLGLLNSKRDFSKVMGKTPCYFTVAEANNINPRLETIDQIKQSINDVVDSIDILFEHDDIINRDNIKRVLNQTTSQYEELKKDILIKIYNL